MPFKSAQNQNNFISEFEEKDRTTKDNWEEFIISSGLSVRAINVLLQNCSSIDEINLLNEKILLTLPTCGKKTANEILNFIKISYQKRIVQPPPSIKDKLANPPDESSLILLPIFSSKNTKEIAVEDLHEGFKAVTKLSDLMLSVRAAKALKKLDIHSIGEVMLSTEATLLKQKNFGRKCLNELKAIIRNLILFNIHSSDTFPESRSNHISSIDYSSYRNMITSFVRLCIKSKRDQDLISRRLCFQTEKIPTLEQIGKHFDITKEGVRQILKKGYRNLKIKTNVNILNSFWERINGLIVSCGGIIDLEELAVILQDEFNWSEPPNPLALGQLFSLWKPELSFACSEDLLIVDCECLSCEHPFKQLLSLDFEEHESFHIQVVGKKFASHCRNKCAAKPVQKFHKAFIRKVIKDTGGKYVLHGDLVWDYDKWLIRYGVNMEDVARYVLEKHGKPMHFSEIAGAVRKENIKFKDISDHNVHAAIIRYKDIEIVKRGTYGLKTWNLGGYRPASDGIEELLDKSGFPLRRMEIIQRLEGEFSEGNISAALTNSGTRFVSIGEGFYDRQENWQKCSCNDYIKLLPEPVADFVLYLTSKNNCSYKLVMALIFIRSMNENGSIYLHNLKEMFCNFYLSRKKKGLVVETASVIASSNGDIEPEVIKNRATQEPLKSFLHSDFFSQNGSNLRIRENLAGLLSDNILKDIVIITLLKGIDDYFARIEPAASNQEYAGDPTVKAEKPLLDIPHEKVKKVIDNSEERAPSIAIKKRQRSKIKL
ncbi:MAG: hypothetical protein KAS66_12380 [Candidatus Omnitrophica bacterium]|nr:hypothetical protein [Candidatus Omnitrophota bacterium]